MDDRTLDPLPHHLPGLIRVGEVDDVIDVSRDALDTVPDEAPSIRRELDVIIVSLYVLSFIHFLFPPLDMCIIPHI
jgi:hypothetical protein